MEGDFRAQLQAGLGTKESYLDSTLIPKIRDSFILLQPLFENIHNILIRKGVLDEDPYKDPHAVEDIVVPTAEPFVRQELRVKMSQRMSNMHSQFVFINSAFRFTIDHVDLERIRRITQLLKYINWFNLSETSSDSATSALAELFAASAAVPTISP